MKYLLITYLIALSFYGFSEQFPRIDRVCIEDKLIHGSIGEYPITLYLKFHEYSYHLGAYSVKGWYYYDRVKTKINLVGLYLYGDLVLYNFKDTSKANNLLLLVTVGVKTMHF